MAGREKIKIYAYEGNGAYLRTFESISEFRKAYYPSDIASRPIFNHNEFGMDYHYIDSLNLIALKERPGKVLIRRIVSIHQSPYCKKQNLVERPIELLNLRGDVIAEFKTQHLLVKLVPEMSPSLITAQLKHNATKSINTTGLYLRYKKQN